MMLCYYSIKENKSKRIIIAAIICFLLINIFAAWLIISKKSKDDLSQGRNVIGGMANWGYTVYKIT